MIRLGQAMDGRLLLGSSEPFPADVKYIEYYKEQRLFSLVFDTDDDESSLMPCEVPNDVAEIVHKCASIMVIPLAEAGIEPYGYMVALIQIGV